MEVWIHFYVSSDRIYIMHEAIMNIYNYHIMVLDVVVRATSVTIIIAYLLRVFLVGGVRTMVSSSSLIHG